MLRCKTGVTNDRVGRGGANSLSRGHATGAKVRTARCQVGIARVEGRGGHAKATTAVAAATVGAVGTAIKVRFLPWGAAAGGRRGGAEEAVVAGERGGG
jgi:hypothetical protein